MIRARDFGPAGNRVEEELQAAIREYRCCRWCCRNEDKLACLICLVVFGKDREIDMPALMAFVAHGFETHCGFHNTFLSCEVLPCAQNLRLAPAVNTVY